MTEEAQNTLRGARLLVTGANGFIGANLVGALLGLGLDVHAMVSPRGISRRLDRFAGQPGFTRLEFDLRKDPTPLVSESRFDVVFHLAAAMPGRNLDEQDVHTVNVTSTIRLAEAMALCGGLLLFAGSVSEYASSDAPVSEDAPLAPATPYGRSKADAVAALQNMDSPGVWSVLRLFGVYGPLESPDRLIPYIAGELSQGREALLTHGLQVRDFIYVDDVAGAFLQAAVCPRARGKVYNIGSGTGTTIREAALLAADCLGRPDLLRFGAREPVSAAPERCIADISRTARELGWEPHVNLPQGVAQTVRWVVEGRHE